MRSILILFIFLVTIMSTEAQTNDTADIKKIFEQYKSAILNDKAEVALNSIDNRSIDYYKGILSDVKKADSNKISTMSLIDKITVLGIRARATKQEIINMKGSDAFLFAIRNGMVGKSSVVNNSVGEITVDNNFAKGELLVKGNKTPIYFHFYKESEGWKLNLTELFSLGNSSLKQMSQESGKPENEYLLEILSLLSGKTLSYEIWHPVE